MENLPFEAGTFDVVACAGSLSYGDPRTVDREILRVLRPGGSIVMVDTLNHNPIYRFNRWINHLRGRRTRSTLMRMPTLARIQTLASHFEQVSVDYFGAMLWAMPLVSLLIGANRAAEFSAYTVSDARWRDLAK